MLRSGKPSLGPIQPANPKFGSSRMLQTMAIAADDKTSGKKIVGNARKRCLPAAQTPMSKASTVTTNHVSTENCTEIQTCSNLRIV